ncbi:serine/threonine protein kinase [Mycolicibacterium rhodesiae JS60]|nr:serine/threonine protein kinase [Mycolicibacterium rhodesiae JS60]
MNAPTTAAAEDSNCSFQPKRGQYSWGTADFGDSRSRYRELAATTDISEGVAMPAIAAA